MTNITDAEITQLKQTKNAQEWGATCDAIKEARNGEYPTDWWKKVMISGLAATARHNWDCDCGQEH